MVELPVGWPVILGEGPVGLRPIRRRDASRWAQLRRDNRDWLSQWESTRPPESTDRSSGYRSLVGDLIRQGRAGRTLPFVVTWQSTFVGQLTVTGVTWGSSRSAQMGYWIAQSHAGRGIIPLAVALTCDHCFDTMGLHRIEIAIRPENTASLRVVKKLGFAEIGLAPRYLHINGHWADHLLFAITVEEVGTSVRARLG